MYLQPCTRVWWGGGRFAGLGDNYSGDHLFPGMRYSNKRLREMEDVRWKRAVARFGGQLSRQIASH